MAKRVIKKVASPEPIQERKNEDTIFWYKRPTKLLSPIPYKWTMPDINYIIKFIKKNNNGN